MEALVYTKAYKLQWIYEKIFLIKKRNFLPSNFRFLFEEPLPFANRSNTVADGVLNPFFLISVENFKYGELHLLSKLLQVASVGQSTLTRFYSLHTFGTTSAYCRIYVNALSNDTAKLAKGMGHNYYGEPAWPNDLLYIFPVVILGTIAGTSFPYFKYSVFFSLGIFRLLPSESSLDT
ncbi:hypothetical protein ACJX0J_003869 [Zea mays]